MKKLPNKYFVYILECADLTYYCGYTKDLDKRIHQHNNTINGARYTKIRRPVKLIYSEKFKTIKEAMSREIEIKKLPRKKKIELVLVQKHV